MNNKFLLFSFLLPLLLSCSVHSPPSEPPHHYHTTNWVLLTKDHPASEAFCNRSISFDTSSASRWGDVVSVWVKYSWGPNQSSCPSEAFQQIHIQTDFHCTTQETKNLYYWSADWGGKNDKGRVLDGAWDPVIPGTQGETILTTLCNINLHLVSP